MDPIEMLTQDHERVRTLFKEFESSDDGQKKRGILDKIIQELTIHTKIEEEVFYPAAKDKVEDTEDMVKEAFIEHEQVDTLIRSLRQMSPDNDDFDAKVTVLKEDVEHHAGEEESDLFPQVRKALSSEQLSEIAQKMQEIKSQQS